jgi:hypothetical protein
MLIYKIESMTLCRRQLRVVIKRKLSSCCVTKGTDVNAHGGSLIDVDATSWASGENVTALILINQRAGPSACRPFSEFANSLVQKRAVKYSRDLAPDLAPNQGGR